MFLGAGLPVKLILFSLPFLLSMIWVWGFVKLQKVRKVAQEPVAPRKCLYCGAEMEQDWVACGECGGEQVVRKEKKYNPWLLRLGIVPGSVLSYVLATVVIGICSSFAYWLGGVGGAIGGLFVGWFWNYDQLMG